MYTWSSNEDSISYKKSKILKKYLKENKINNILHKLFIVRFYVVYYDRHNKEIFKIMCKVVKFNPLLWVLVIFKILYYIFIEYVPEIIVDFKEELSGLLKGQEIQTIKFDKKLMRKKGD